jgi:hypothetical protein
MFVALMVLAIAVTRLFPDTATGRFLHCWLAEKPAARPRASRAPRSRPARPAVANDDDSDRLASAA